MPPYFFIPHPLLLFVVLLTVVVMAGVLLGVMLCSLCRFRSIVGGENLIVMCFVYLAGYHAELLSPPSRHFWDAEHLETDGAAATACRRATVVAWSWHCQPRFGRP